MVEIPKWITEHKGLAAGGVGGFVLVLAYKSYRAKKSPQSASQYLVPNVLANVPTGETITIVGGGGSGSVNTPAPVTTEPVPLPSPNPPPTTVIVPNVPQSVYVPSYIAPGSNFQVNDPAVNPFVSPAPPIVLAVGDTLPAPSGIGQRYVSPGTGNNEFTYG